MLGPHSLGASPLASWFCLVCAGVATDVCNLTCSGPSAFTWLPGFSPHQDDQPQVTRVCPSGI